MNTQDSEFESPERPIASDPHEGDGVGIPWSADRESGFGSEGPQAGEGPGEGVPAAPSAPARRRRALAAGALGMLVAAAVVAGAGIAHEFWTAGSNLSSAPALPVGGASGSLRLPFAGQSGPGSFGGSFGPSSAGGSSGSTGSATAASGAPSDVAAIAVKVDPGLVDINSIFGFGSEGAGTGIVLTSDGEILTNNHVIDGATKITATDVGNGKTYTATVIGYDPIHDVALLKLKGASGLQTSTLGDSSGAAVGEAVVGIGNAGGAGGIPSSAGGSITGLDRSITARDDIDGASEQLSGLIQTNAAIQPGDSGGPLVNSAGQVLGMDTAGAAGFVFRSSASQADAIPVNQAVAIVKAIEAGQGTATVHVGATAFLGVSVSLSDVTGGFGGFNGAGQASRGASSAAGVDLGSVVSGDPAQRAGLVAGDVITSLDGKAVVSGTALRNLLSAHHPGDTVKLGWTDTSGQVHSSTVQLASGPPA
jgi:S1-C subfamily serine protease